MIPAMWSSYLHDQTPEEMVSTFAQSGWRDLELSTEHAAVLLERGDPKQVGQAFNALAADQGVRFPQGHLLLLADIAGHDQPQTLDTLRRWLDLFLAVGIRAGVLHPGGGTLVKQGVPVEEVDELRTSALQTLSDHIKGSDFTICLENGGGARTRAHTLVDIIKRADRPNLGICLDTGHLNLGGGD